MASMDFAEERFIYIPRFALIVSLLIHLSFPLLIGGVHLMEKSGFRFLPHRKAQKDVYQTFIQVDIVALPEQLINQKPVIDPTLPAVDNPAVVPRATPPRLTHIEETKEDLLVPDAEEQRRAEERKKAGEKKMAAEEKMAADRKEKQRRADEKTVLKRLEEEVNREQAIKALAKAGEAFVGRPKISGNVISQGTSTKGSIGTDALAYGALVRQRIRDCFDVYEWQTKKELVTGIHFDILPSGRVINLFIIKPSQDSLYDSAVKKAVIECQPYPLPADSSIVEGGFTVTFKPNQE